MDKGAWTFKNANILTLVIGPWKMPIYWPWLLGLEKCQYIDPSPWPSQIYSMYSALISHAVSVQKQCRFSAYNSHYLKIHTP